MFRFTRKTTLTLCFALGMIVFYIMPSRAQVIQLLISRGYDNDILGYNLANGSPLGSFVAASGGETSQARTMIIGPDRNLYVSGSFGGVNRFNGQTGAFIDHFVPAGSGGLSNITMGITFGPDGNLYVADYNGTRAIRRYKGTTGAYIDTFVAPGAGNLTRPYEMTFGRDGNLYVVDGSSLDPSDVNAGVKRFNGKTGTFIDHFIPNGRGGLSVPTDITFGPDGNLYVASQLSHSVLRYDSASGAFLSVAASGNGLFQPICAQFGPDGLLYVLDARSPNATDAVLRFDGVTNTFIDTFVVSIPQVQTNSPYYLAFTPAPTYPVSGTITLGDCNDPEQNITFEFRPKNGGASFKVKQVLTQSGPNSGTFSIPNIPAGTYDIAIKGYCWLQRVIPNVVVNGNVSGLTATLLSADLNNDNSVDISDFGILVNEYGEVGDP